MSEAPSESLTVTDTVGEAGPSGNVQTKLPAPGGGVERVDADLVPLVPHSVASSVNVSAPGSVVVKL